MTFPDPYSLMLRQERRLETTVLLRCRRCLVRACICSAVRGVGSGVVFAPGRCFTVCGSERQRFREDGWVDGAFGRCVGQVVCEESMVRERSARWVISNRKVSRYCAGTRFQAWHNGCIRGAGCSSMLAADERRLLLQLAPTPNPGPGEGGPRGQGYRVWAISPGPSIGSPGAWSC